MVKWKQFLRSIPDLKLCESVIHVASHMQYMKCFYLFFLAWLLYHWESAAEKKMEDFSLSLFQLGQNNINAFQTYQGCSNLYTCY